MCSSDLDAAVAAASPNDAASNLAPQLLGGGGRDLFVLPDPQQAWSITGPWLACRPSLTDLSLVVQADGSLGLSDRLAFRQVSTPPGLRDAPSAASPDSDLNEPVPSGATGVGDIRLLPIAPLELLLAGMDSASPLQPAIALGSDASLLVLLGPGQRIQELASLPGLHQPAAAAEPIAAAG